MPHRWFRLIPILCLAVAACAGRSRSGAATDGNVISAAELNDAGSVSVYDVIQRLRPLFLRERGPVSLLNASSQSHTVVFVDQSEYGALESLRTIPASRVERVRFFPGQEAVTRFGSTYGSGVIQLTFRAQ
jgi:hypothetical protein